MSNDTHSMSGSRQTCRGTKKNGGPCGATPTADGYCPFHSSRFNDADRSAWALRGAATTNQKTIARKLAEAELDPRQQEVLAQIPELQEPDLSKPKAFEKYITKLIAETKAGRVPPSIANSIKGLLEVRLKLVELSISKQIAELERKLR